MAGVLVGTSGWSYRSWRGPFFPEKLPKRSHLEFYAEHFPTTELNSVFYRTPTVDAVRGWAERTPEDFVFAWKASKFITHWKRLKETSRNSLDLMESRLRLLRGKAGPVLFQLPPFLRKDAPRLSEFVSRLPEARKIAFEFRHDSWFYDEIYDILRSRDVALCAADTDDVTDVEKLLVPTASWGYMRLRRTEYTSDELGAWAERVQRQAWSEAYVFFKHEDEGKGPRFAVDFRARLR